MKLLMLYNYAPGTTALYLRRAFEQLCEVRSCGREPHAMGHHDLVVSGPVVYLPRVFAALRKRYSFDADALLYVESPGPLYTAGLTGAPVRTAFYAVDSHVIYPAHARLAALYDVVFMAQKEYAAMLRPHHPCVEWLPLACDPRIHRPCPAPAEYDVCFLGGMHGDRVELLDRLRQRFTVFTGWVDPEAMSEVYGRARVVFNRSFRHDLNMRVFEALASGACLLTDRLAGNGLEELFRPGHDLITYEPSTLEQQVEMCLASPTVRDAVARNGRAAVLASHTYDHRAARILQRLAERTPPRTRRGLIGEVKLLWQARALAQHAVAQ